MNKQHDSILVLLDLSAVFDTVDHAILLRRLETSFGITDAALSWFSSYLCGRSQLVSVNGETSDCYHLPFGVSSGFVSRVPTLQCLCQQAVRGHQAAPAQRTRIRGRYPALFFLQPRQLP